MQYDRKDLVCLCGMSDEKKTSRIRLSELSGYEVEQDVERSWGMWIVVVTRQRVKRGRRGRVEVREEAGISWPPPR